MHGEICVRFLLGFSSISAPMPLISNALETHTPYAKLNRVLGHQEIFIGYDSLKKRFAIKFLKYTRQSVRVRTQDVRVEAVTILET